MKSVKVLFLIFVLIASCIVFSYADANSPSSGWEERLGNDLKAGQQYVDEIDRLAAELREKLRELRLYDDFNAQDVSESDGAYPAEIMHHTCGYGGDSCRICRRIPVTQWCGCILEAYRCCCGKTMGGKMTYCPNHP